MAYINIMQKVLESSLTVKNWNEMFQAALDKTEKMKTVQIDNRVGGHAGIMRNKVTSTNPTLALVKAKEEASKAIYQLAKAKKVAVQSEAFVMKKYTDFVEADR